MKKLILLLSLFAFCFAEKPYIVDTPEAEQARMESELEFAAEMKIEILNFMKIQYQNFLESRTAWKKNFKNKYYRNAPMYGDYLVSMMQHKALFNSIRQTSPSSLEQFAFSLSAIILCDEGKRFFKKTKNGWKAKNNTGIISLFNSHTGVITKTMDLVCKTKEIEYKNVGMSYTNKELAKFRKRLDKAQAEINKQADIYIKKIIKANNEDLAKCFKRLDGK